MNRKAAILNFSLATAILFTILFQSVHSFMHLEETFVSARCHHSHATGRTQLTHQHHNFDHCLVCDFSFSHTTAHELFSFRLIAPLSADPYYSRSYNLVYPSALSAASLRGPPCFIV